MGSTQQKKQERQILVAYLFMLLGLFTLLPILVAYLIAVRASKYSDIEVWLESHALWIMRNLLIFICIIIFAALWFIPLIFVPWNAYIWTTGCTIIGVIFSLVAWLYLVNAWLKGVFRFFGRKPVY